METYNNQLSSKEITNIDKLSSQENEEAKVEILLNKGVYGVKDAKRVLDKDFIEFLPKNTSISEIFDMYNSLFYEIETQGKKSHTFIVRQSSKYSGFPLNPLFHQINTLNEQIIVLKENIDSIENEHPFINNRSIIQNRTNNELNYYMQSGRKRQINDKKAIQVIKRQLGLNKDAPDLEVVILLDSQAIGGIVSGPPINNLNDLDIDILEINRYGQNSTNIAMDDNTII